MRISTFNFQASYVQRNDRNYAVSLSIYNIHISKIRKTFSNAYSYFLLILAQIRNNKERTFDAQLWIIWMYGHFICVSQTQQNHTKPNRTKPNRTKPNQTTESAFNIYARYEVHKRNWFNNWKRFIYIRLKMIDFVGC